MSHISSIGAGMYTDLSVALPSTAQNYSTFNATETNWETLFRKEVGNVGGVKGTNTFVRVQNVREFPSIGTPANIVNVPVYGAKTSRQVQGQADAPTVEITLNYVPSDWATSGNLLGPLVGDGNQYGFRFTLLNTAPTSYSSVASSAAAALSAATSASTTVTFTAIPVGATAGQTLVNATDGTVYGIIDATTATTLTLISAANIASGTSVKAIGIDTAANSSWYWYGKLESLLVNPQLTDANTATLTISVQSDFYGAYTVG
jgi:hypothetical protein